LGGGVFLEGKPRKNWTKVLQKFRYRAVGAATNFNVLEMKMMILPSVVRKRRETLMGWLLLPGKSPISLYKLPEQP
jgi:hypothetical protein